MKLLPTVCCIHCQKSTSAKGLQVHYNRMHSEEGKAAHRARVLSNRDKISKTLKDRANKIKLEKVKEYMRAPTTCLYCSAVLQYDRRKCKFCNSRCAAKFNNSKRSSMSEQTKAKISAGVRKSIADAKNQTLRRFNMYTAQLNS